MQCLICKVEAFHNCSTLPMLAYFDETGTKWTSVDALSRHSVKRRATCLRERLARFAANAMSKRKRKSKIYQSAWPSNYQSSCWPRTSFKTWSLIHNGSRTPAPIHRIKHKLHRTVAMCYIKRPSILLYCSIFCLINPCIK